MSTHRAQIREDAPATLGQVIDVLESAYPLAWAEDWDRPGLVVGERSRGVRSIMLAVDPTCAVAQEGARADLLITHHPLLLRGISHLPADTGDPRRALAALPEEIRGDLRWYTIRAHRPETAEIDVDVVCTDHGGPGSRWIRGVAVGDEVGVWVGVALHVDAPGHHLLLADETGLPGLLAILEAARAHPDRTYTALVELPDEDHMPPELAEHDVRVVLRGSRAPGTALTPALEALDPGAAHLPPIDHAWICAEGGTVAACRARVLRGHHVPRRHVVSSGFWRLGRPRP